MATPYQPPTITYALTIAGILNGDAPSYEDLYVTASSSSAYLSDPSVPVWYDGWCLDRETSITNYINYTATIYSSYEYAIIRENSNFNTVGVKNGDGPLSDANVPVGVGAQPYLENLDIVNWLLNNFEVDNNPDHAYSDDIGYPAVTYNNIKPYTVVGHPELGLFTYGDIEEAIYQLLGDGWSGGFFLGKARLESNQPHVVSLVNFAVAQVGSLEGGIYIPDAGEKIAVLLDNGKDPGGKVYQPGMIQTLAAKLGDYVWEDRNANGIQDDGNTGINGATVNLWRDLNGNGSLDGGIELLATTTTHTKGVSAGYYEFKGLTPGLEYQVEFVRPLHLNGVSPAVNPGSDTQSDSNGVEYLGHIYSEKIYLDPGEFDQSIDQGFYTDSNDNNAPRASLGDRVWLDCNGNGKQDVGEVGVANVAVKLFGGGADGVINGIGDTSISTVTDENGYYKFSDLAPGVEYQVQFTPLTGYSFTTANAGGDDTLDSDAQPTGVDKGKTQVVTLYSGENNPTLDAGLNPVCRPVTFDFSGSSATDGCDGNTRTYTDALTGVSVTASAYSQTKGTNTWQDAWLGAYSGGLGVTDSSEGSGSGNTHTVDNVGRNNYVVLQFSQSVKLDQAYLGYVVNDSDMKVWIGNSATSITSMNNSVLSSMSFSEVNTTTLSTARWADLNAGGVTGNVVIIAADTTDTSPEDYFKVDKVAVCAPDCGPPVAKASLGNLVWEDKNYNGLQDGGENGIANVTVKLLNSAGTVVLATTTTDATGTYEFKNLNPGDYKVQVVAPSGYYVTKQIVGDDISDSDINSSGITTDVISLSAGEDDTSWDAGLYRKACVGDKVWEDWNHNNVQDSLEGGIGNIKVQLMDATGTNVLKTTYTSSSGDYKFSNLDPGDYVLRFDKTNVSFSNSHWGGTYNMSDWKWAVKDAGGEMNNDTKDSDVVGNAVNKTNVSKTDAFSLVSGQNDMTRDAGITPIVIDLDGNGIQTISRANSGGSFDLFGNGSKVDSGWISGSDGFLAVDKNGNGTIDGISELFGGTARGAGFAQLAAYDSNNDGLVNTSDVGFADLSIWRDVNGNHQTDAGELLSLDLAGVSELVTGYTELPFLDHQGNIHLERSSASLSDGQTVSMTDVYFNVSADDAAAAGVALPGIAELLNELASCQAPVTDPGWLFA